VHELKRHTLLKHTHSAPLPCGPEHPGSAWGVNLWLTQTLTSDHWTRIAWPETQPPRVRRGSQGRLAIAETTADCTLTNFNQNTNHMGYKSNIYMG